MTRLGRRRVLRLGAAACWPALAGCGPAHTAPERWQARWVGPDPARGHRLRGPQPPLPDRALAPRRTEVAIVGGGVAGLAAARAFLRQGVDELTLFELEPEAGGNSRGHVVDGRPCPLGAHYLPLPGADAPELQDWLEEVGVLQRRHGVLQPDARQLVHEPQERLWIDGAWAEGVVPPAAPGTPTQAQYRRFGALVAQARRTLGFALPSVRAPWTPGHAALDSQTFAAWLDAHRLDDPRLRWYLDYVCLDDYGADAATVSAWAGLHYFGSRGGFHTSGDEAPAEPLLTWPEGNARLVQHLAAPLGERLRARSLVRRVDAGRRSVTLWVEDEAGALQAWQARTVVFAVPLFVARRLLVSAPPAALVAAAARLRHAPWLVANVALEAPLTDRAGAPPAWDNVAYGQRRLGYVDATHQSLRPDTERTLLTAYEAWPLHARAALLGLSARQAAQHVLQGLAVMHPDLAAQVTRVELARHGHAMVVPEPGVRGDPALSALRSLRGPLRFVHADLAGYSVFEEAFGLGMGVAGPPV